MKHIFLSDVHLGAFRGQKNDRLEEELIQLIGYCAENDIHIHVLGDLFDYWMEYPNYIPPLGKKLLARFKAYNQTHSRATFVTGNHDYWTRNYFRDMGFRVEHEYTKLEIDGKSFFLFHGDGLSDKTFHLPRPVLNRFLRNRWVILMFQALYSGEAGNHLMKMFSEFTRDEEDINPERISNWAKEMLKKRPIDYIISGHDHVPRIETFYGGTYINTGAFYLRNTAASYNNGRFELVVWNAAERTLKPMHKINKKTR